MATRTSIQDILDSAILNKQKMQPSSSSLPHFHVSRWTRGTKQTDIRTHAALCSGYIIRFHGARTYSTKWYFLFM